MVQGTKGVVITLATLLLAFSASTAVAFGQSATPPVTYTYTAYVDNQATVNNCSAGEPVMLNGTVRVTYQFTSDASGVNHFDITAANNLTGIGQSTAGNYTASDSADYILNSSQPSTETTVQLKSDLVSQGPAPSMTLVETLDIVVDTSGNVSAQVIDNSTQCGN